MPSLAVALLVLVAACGTPQSGATQPVALPDVSPNELRAVDDFDVIADTRARSKALFLEVGRVLTHPRCLNCHPAGDTPYQGMALALHDPPVTRGPADRGVPGMECAGCHQDRNQTLARVPGAPEWHLAPIEMAWAGQSLSAICAQIKDPAQNGGKSFAQLIEHSSHDALVGWAWAPGADREPAPGTQARFGALFAAWIETGAACPDEPAHEEKVR